MSLSLKAAARTYWPLILALILLGVTVGKLYRLCVQGDDGHFVYIIDDAYIHMAIAKNFAAHGVWGVTPYRFSSSSSSILWPLLLSAIYVVLGPRELAPLILNILVAALALGVIHVLLRRLGLPGGYIFFALLGMVLLIPLPALILTGMEHVLQVAVTIPFVYIAAEELAQQTHEARHSAWLWILAVLSTLVRYEGLFLVLPVCLLFLLGRRWRKAFGLGAVGSPRSRSMD